MNDCGPQSAAVCGGERRTASCGGNDDEKDISSECLGKDEGKRMEGGGNRTGSKTQTNAHCSGFQPNKIDAQGHSQRHF